MRRSEVVLAILAAANGATLSPAQLQKAAFLLSRRMPQLFDADQHFDFVPYDYGPFDKAVYDEANALALAGLVEVGPAPWGRWNVYSATGAGIETARRIFVDLPDGQRAYIQQVVDWVRQQSFTSLVKSIYAAYPEMRANSIFRD